MVVDGPTFRVVAGLELKKSLRLQYSVSILTILLTPDRSVPDPDLFAEKIGHGIAALLRETDLIARASSPMMLDALLVATDLDQVPVVTDRLREEMRHARFPTDGGPVAVHLRIGAASFPTTASTLEALVDHAQLRAREEAPTPTDEPSG